MSKTTKSSTSPVIYGKDSLVTTTKAQIQKMDDNSGNMTMNAYNGKIKTFANTLSKQVTPVTPAQFEHICERVAVRQEHGFEWLTGNEKRLSVDKLIKINCSLSKEQIEKIERVIELRKKHAPTDKALKSAVAGFFKTKHSDLDDMPLLRYKGSKLVMTAKASCETEDIKRLASGKALIGLMA